MARQLVGCGRAKRHMLPGPSGPALRGKASGENVGMNLTTLGTLLLALGLIIGFAGIAVADDDQQTGTTTSCADYNALWVVPGVVLEDARVEVDPGQTYTITSDDGVPWVDFYDANGEWVDYNYDSDEGHLTSGVVPAEAAYGVVCVGALGEYPDAPLVTATFTYHDA